MRDMPQKEEIGIDVQIKKWTQNAWTKHTQDKGNMSY